jgi:hypothetical protein
METQNHHVHQAECWLRHGSIARRKSLHRVLIMAHKWKVKTVCGGMGVRFTVADEQSIDLALALNCLGRRIDHSSIPVPVRDELVELVDPKNDKQFVLESFASYRLETIFELRVLKELLLHLGKDCILDAKRIPKVLEQRIRLGHEYLNKGVSIPEKQARTSAHHRPRNPQLSC